MQYKEEFDRLISEWDERLRRYNSAYCDYGKAYSEALVECKFELQLLLDRLELHENLMELPSREVQDIIDGWKADQYLSSMEEHDLKYA